MSKNNQKEMASLAVAAEVELNLHDLNNELSAGNVTMIRTVNMVLNGQPVLDVPAVSGRMLKHWHWENFRQRILAKPSPKLCGACTMGETIRPANLIEVKEGNTLKWQFISAEEGKQLDEAVVPVCAACDLHGFLVAAGARSDRRLSRILFAWLLPTEQSASRISETRETITHSRVQKTSYDVEGLSEKKEKGAQMIYDKTYASGDYAFLSYLNLDGIGKGLVEDKETQLLSNNPEELTRRKRAALWAYYDMLAGGKMGASLSHSLPHMRVTKLLLALSPKPMPVPVSPIYTGWVDETLSLLRDPEEVVFIYTITPLKPDPNRIISCKDIKEVFEKADEKLGGENDNEGSKS